jgi:uncharacterized membrane protein
VFTLYNLFKFLHVAGAITWIGGVITIAALTARLARGAEGAALQALTRQSAFFGQAVLGPAALTTLVAGIALAVELRQGFPFWMAWGLAGVASSMIAGGALVRPATARLSAEKPRLTAPA